jgi:MFS family permease
VIERTDVSEPGTAPQRERIPGEAAKAVAAWTRAPWVAAGLIAAALALAYLLAAPSSADLAAATYRSGLLARAGLTIWDNGWYSGHHLLGYSVISPALGALVGVRVAIAIAALAAALLFARLASDWLAPSAARLCACWFALGLGVGLLSGRVPFYIGLALGLAALWATLGDRPVIGCALAAACSLASPVAGAFLVLAGVADAVGVVLGDVRNSDSTIGARSRDACGHGWRTRGVTLAFGALAPIVLLALAFSDGGYEPFSLSAFWPAFAGLLGSAGLLAWLTPRQWVRLRAGILLYSAACLAAYALHTPVGGNVTRLGQLVAGPLLAGALWQGTDHARRNRAVLALAAPLLLYWQLTAPLRDVLDASADPSTHATYYAPLLTELSRLAHGSPIRVEVPPTAAHWEAAYVAPRFSLARGWERQLDTSDAGIFYGGRLSSSSYRHWLLESAVSYVAVPDAPLDHAAKTEARLIARGLPYLRERWSSRHWRVYEVLGAEPLVTPPARVVDLATDSFTVRAPASGSFLVRVRFTPYWRLTNGHGCVREAAGGWTEVEPQSPPGPTVARVAIDFSLARVFARGSRCS